VEKHEKLAQRTVSPVHGHRLTFKVGNLFLQNLLRKIPYSLFESGRGLLDLQLSYLSIGTVLFKILEIFVLKQGISKTNSCRLAPRAATPHPSARAALASAPEVGADGGHTPPDTRSFPRPTRAPRCIGACGPRASPSPRRTRAVHAANRRSVRVRAEEHRSTAASRRRRHGHARRVYSSTAAVSRVLAEPPLPCATVVAIAPR
jgi:hypothetical protein